MQTLIGLIYTQDLQSMYSNLRRTRGDGNCFFRAFSFAYLERLLQDSSDLPRCSQYRQYSAPLVHHYGHPLWSYRFLKVVTKTRDVLLGMGYPPFTLEDFHDSVSSSDVLPKDNKLPFSVQFIAVVESTARPETTHAALLKV